MSSVSIDESLLRETIMDTFGGDPEQFSSFVNIFSKYVTELKDFSSRTDFHSEVENIAKSAHKMKAGAGAFGATSLLEALENLEANILKNNANNAQELYNTAVQVAEESLKEINSRGENILKG